MIGFMSQLKFTVAAFILSCAPLAAQDRNLDDLFDALAQADTASSKPIVEKIWSEWSQSGSPAMDLLLKRGRDAMEENAMREAIGHFTALIDHAPRFAEGYNMRATALYQTNRYGAALDDLRMALALNPRHFGAMTGLAIVLEETGFEDGALFAWREVKKLYPAHESVDAAIARLELLIEGSTL